MAAQLHRGLEQTLYVLEEGTPLQGRVAASLANRPHVPGTDAGHPLRLPVRSLSHVPLLCLCTSVCTCLRSCFGLKSRILTVLQVPFCRQAGFGLLHVPEMPRLTQS